MPRLMVAALLFLAACAPGGPGGVYRNAASPIYSNAVFDQGRLTGNWDQVAMFASPGKVGCRPGSAAFGGRSGSANVSFQLCLSGRGVSGSGAFAPAGPGRFAVPGKDGIGQDWWVLWVDEGYRTMAIGNPSGTFGFILNRGKTLPTDRLKAARQVFDFNGYDTARLIVFGR